MKLNKLWRILSFVFVLLFLAIGTIFVYYYSKGYQFDIVNGKIDKTGVITIDTLPRKATIYIDGKEKGKSPKAITGISEGEHTVLLTKDGYQDWTMNIQVLSEQSIPVSASLFYEVPEVEEIAIESLELYKADKVFFDEKNQIGIFTVWQDSNLTLQVWGYPINRRFWELETQPYLITEFFTSESNLDLSTNIVNPTDYSIIISPNSQRALMSTNIDNTPTYYLFYTDRYIEEPIKIDKLSSSEEVPPTWSLDSQYLIYSKNNELRTMNIESFAQTVVYEKNQSDRFIWTSTNTSQIYYVEYNDEDYSITRIRATGDNRSVVLENVVSLNKLSYTENTKSSDHTPIDIEISEDGDYIIILENDRLLVYSFKDDKFYLYPAENPVFLGFSLEYRKFIYSNGDIPNLFEYNLVVEQGDPIHSVGPSAILDINSEFDPTIYRWEPEGRTLLFSEKNNEPGGYRATGLSIDGLNKFPINVLLQSDKFAIGNSGKYIIGICENDMLCKITVRE